MDLYDYKPSLTEWQGKDLPESVRQGQRLTELTANQGTLPLVASKFRFAQYGEDARRPGTYAYNCLLARRMAERNVRFIQIFHRGWDQHSSINYELPKQARDVDQASAALILDLEQRGLLQDTLVVWGSEFGRTSYSQGNIDDPNYGRDHHPRCYTVWLAGGGVRPGVVYGQTDELGYNVAENGVHVHDLNATILHCLGINHRRLTYPFKGRDFRLTDIGGTVVEELLI